MFVLVTTALCVSTKLTVLVEPGPVRLMLAVFVPPAPRPLSAAADDPALLIEALVFAELLLLATPDVAPPPVVLPDTLADPEVDPWVLTFATVAEFVFVSTFVPTTVDVIVLVEPGPVVPIVPVAADTSPTLRPTPINAAASACSNFFIKVTPFLVNYYCFPQAFTRLQETFCILR